MTSSGYKQVFQPNFLKLWLAQLFSEIGNSLYFIALNWLLWEQTHSTVQSGIFALFFDLPQLVLGLWIGVILARFRRKSVLIFTDLLRGIGVLMVLAFILTGHLNVYVLYIAILIEGIMLVMFNPTRTAFVQDVVTDEQLEKANALSTITSRAVGTAGYGISGVIVFTVGAITSVAFNVFSFFISAFLVSGIKVHETTEESQRPPFRQRFNSGFVYLKQNKTLLWLFGIFIFMNVGGAPLTVLMPAYSEKSLSAGVTSYGLLQGAWFLGMAVGAYAVGRWSPKNLHIGMAIGFGAQGAAQLLLGVSNALWSSMFILLLHGAFISIANVPLISFMQRFVPKEHQVNVFSILTTLLLFANPLAFAATGFLAASLGVNLSFQLGGVLQVIPALAILLIPALRFPMQKQEEDEAA